MTKPVSRCRLRDVVSELPLRKHKQSACTASLMVVLPFSILCPILAQNGCTSHYLRLLPVTLLFLHLRIFVLTPLCNV